MTNQMGWSWGEAGDDDEADDDDDADDDADDYDGNNVDGYDGDHEGKCDSQNYFKHSCISV